MKKITKRDKTQILGLFFGLVAYGILQDPINSIVNSILTSTLSKIIGGSVFVFLFFYFFDL